VPSETELIQARSIRVRQRECPVKVPERADRLLKAVILPEAKGDHQAVAVVPVQAEGIHLVEVARPVAAAALQGAGEVEVLRAAVPDLEDAVATNGNV
jgi:hypothetical protein